MKILLIGNISSGKSVIGRLLVDEFNNFEYISIDSIRKVYGDETAEAEEECKEIFLSKIHSTRDQIIEFSGGGKLREAVTARIKNERNILILNPRCSVKRR
ncbi:hypothetical protein JWZ98_03380 [Methylomonas sp. EFPC1]|uniref:hypothetical protein n=1 Tax=Methylomonas sp. EFPC1 TaxID=2812647 RepID=UPI001967D35C|nr:hypothetical protein [Methylomonas sp. EFPC1]QSB02017.1 hypothetical protein JWZ98_03380 [Methylomonas sp. EFPC1]